MCLFHYYAQYRELVKNDWSSCTPQEASYPVTGVQAVELMLVSTGE